MIKGAATKGLLGVIKFYVCVCVCVCVCVYFQMFNSENSQTQRENSRINFHVLISILPLVLGASLIQVRWVLGSHL